MCRARCPAPATRASRTPVAAPRLLGWSHVLGGELGIAQPSDADVLAGNRVLPDMQPYAARYGGHQFGTWAGQLGDGRAIRSPRSSPPTAAARSCSSRAPGARRIRAPPTAAPCCARRSASSSAARRCISSACRRRALSLAATGEPVIRDMFYDGHPAPEPGAVVCRVAPSFVRFGNFQIHAAHGEMEPLRRLADYVVREFFPGHTYVSWYQEVCRRTALLVDWMRLGFVHGVMNTDNMSVLGLTIDYGPYGWLEGYDPQWTPNTTDARAATPTATSRRSHNGTWRASLRRFCRSSGTRRRSKKGSRSTPRPSARRGGGRSRKSWGWPRSTSRATTSCCRTSVCSTRSRPTSPSFFNLARAARQRRRRGPRGGVLFRAAGGAPPGAGELAATLCRALARCGAGPRRAHEPGQP